VKAEVIITQSIFGLHDKFQGKSERLYFPSGYKREFNLTNISRNSFHGPFRTKSTLFLSGMKWNIKKNSTISMNLRKKPIALVKKDLICEADGLQWVRLLLTVVELIFTPQNCLFIVFPLACDSGFGRPW
jgi:hypothetical protein